MRVTGLFCMAALLAQSQTFEVASVKPAAPYKGGPIHIGVSGGPGTDDPGRITFSNATLMLVLTQAFERESYQIEGPGFLHDDMFDISAKVPPGTTGEQLRVMLQNLLAERFGMTVHREKQDLPAYVLTVAKGGPKIAMSKATTDGVKTPPSGTKSSPGITRITCNRCTMTRFVGMLGNPGGRFLIDSTGLAGSYDFTLVFEPEQSRCKDCVVGGGNGALPPPPAPATSVDSPPILTIAVEQQLGLKLERKNMPVEVVVIDHIERIPAAN